MTELIIFGISSFAKQMHYYFDSSSNYKVIGFALDEEYKTMDKFCGLPVYTTNQLLNLVKKKSVKCFLALGYKNMRARKTKYYQLKNSGIDFISYISPYAVCQIDRDNIGENTLILANATVEPFTNIGNNVFIWSGVIICHNVTIDDHCFIAAGTVVGGHSKIGNSSFLGFNSTVSNELTIAEETLLAANSFLQSNSEKYGFYTGSPAFQKSSHKKQGIMIV